MMIQSPREAITTYLSANRAHSPGSLREKLLEARHDQALVDQVTAERRAAGAYLRGWMGVFMWFWLLACKYWYVLALSAAAMFYRLQSGSMFVNANELWIDQVGIVGAFGLSLVLRYFKGRYERVGLL